MLVNCACGAKDYLLGQEYELDLMRANRFLADGLCEIIERDFNSVEGRTKEFTGGVTPERFGGPAPDIVKPGPRNQFLNLSQAAKRLSLPPEKVRELVIDGVLKGVKIDGVPPAWQIEIASVESYAALNGIEGEAAETAPESETPKKKARGGNRLSARKPK
jgi:hypothetical protein